MEKRILVLIFTFFLSMTAWASNDKNCWVEAGERYNLDPWLLYAIGWTESSMNPNATNGNKNATMDVGLMQINSWWLPKLRSMGIHREHLFDPCTSIHVGAWILAQNFRQYGFSWKAIGAYNAQNEKKQRIYAEKVYWNYNWFTKNVLDLQKAASQQGVDLILDHPTARRKR
jgi:soluble lytic murein transglycosylase-like protein